MAWKRKGKRKGKASEDAADLPCVSFSLRVLGSDNDGDGYSYGDMGCVMDPVTSPFAYVSAPSSDDSCGDPLHYLNEAIAAGRGFLYVRSHAQFLLRVRSDPHVPKGCIIMTDVQMRTMEGNENIWALLVQG